MKVGVTMGVWWWACVWCTLTLAAPDHHDQQHSLNHHRNKLLYILLDGFRWDYVTMQPPTALPGFSRFLKEGGRARWTNPIFPSVSFPSWTSLVTGLYAETHGVVGNYFYDPETKDVFSLFDAETTGMGKWWTSEPLWTTAEKAGLKTAQFLWSRCDVPIDGVTTHFCEKFIKIPGKKIFQQNIGRALDKLDEGYDLVQVYTEHTDNTGHTKGPDSPEMLQAVRDLDTVLLYLLDQLHHRGLNYQVNIVIVSDHGMTYTAPGAISRHELDDYLNTTLVENIADKGAFMNIKVPRHNVDKVYEQLSRMPGVSVYKREDVPEEFHFRHHKYIHDIILLADKGHLIMASRSGKQLPPRNDNFVHIGAHGYNPREQEMKGIFFAKGPDFKCGWTLEPIDVVDVYQVLTHTLRLDPRPHNGTWSHVEDALRGERDTESCEVINGASAASCHTLFLSLATLFLSLAAGHPW